MLPALWIGVSDEGLSQHPYWRAEARVRSQLLPREEGLELAACSCPAGTFEGFAAALLPDRGGPLFRHEISGALLYATR